MEAAAKVRWNRVGLYYGLTMLVTIAITFAWTASGRSWQGSASAVALNLCMLVPGLVAAALQRWVFRAPLASTLGLRRPSLTWLAFGWLLAPLIMFFALALALLLPNVSFVSDLSGLASLGMSASEIAGMRQRTIGFPGGAVPALLLQGLLLGPSLLAIGGLGEEVGWRGFLYHELASLGATRRTMLIGLLWGIWHLPAVIQGYAYPLHPVLGSLMLLVLTQLLAPIYSYLRDRSGGVLVPAIFHGTCSATGAIAVGFVRGGSELLIGFTGLAGLVATGLVCLLVVRYGSTLQPQ